LASTDFSAARGISDHTLCSTKFFTLASPHLDASTSRFKLQVNNLLDGWRLVEIDLGVKEHNFFNWVDCFPHPFSTAFDTAED
jgi:hypothetical protein